MDRYYQMAGMPPPNMQAPAESCQGGIFVPFQQNTEMWPPPIALANGTVFPCLYSPWEKGENYDG
jgi:hypothetical protein